MGTKSAAVGYVMYMLLILVLFVGWVLNLLKILAWDEETGMLVLRIIGAFISPLGGLLGWL